MRQEGVLRGGVRTPEGFRDLVIYGILEDEWRAQAR
jgi:RimJ/RimL family protein N-acetyltransferase